MPRHSESEECHQASTSDGEGDQEVCAICLETPGSRAVQLPCKHAFCPDCLGSWRNKYEWKTMKEKLCPICRAEIPATKEMVAQLQAARQAIVLHEMRGDTQSSAYQLFKHTVKELEEVIGDGSTILEDNSDAIIVPERVKVAILETGAEHMIQHPDIIPGFKLTPKYNKEAPTRIAVNWVMADKRRVNATTEGITDPNVSAGIESKVANQLPMLHLALSAHNKNLMALFLQLGADVDTLQSDGTTAFLACLSPDRSFFDIARLLLEWGTTFPDGEKDRESYSRIAGYPEIRNLLSSKLGGRRCEINGGAKELNGKTCVVEGFLSDRHQYRVRLEHSKETVHVSPSSLARRDRTPSDPGYYIIHKNGKLIKKNFSSSEECQAFVADLDKEEDEGKVEFSAEDEAKADQAAADLLAELGLEDNVTTSATKKQPKVAGGDGKKKKATKKKKKKRQH